jgi:hypothetical protein
LLADLGDFIISAFENPQKAINDFSNLIKENITNRLNGLLNLVPSLGKAVKQLFEGDFAGAAETAVNAAAKVTLGVENFTDKVKEATEATKDFIKEQQREANLAADVADMRAKADKLDRELLVERATLENQIADLRLKARQEDEFTAKQRAEFIKEAQVLEDQLLQKETEALQLRADAIALENTFARSNKENLDAEAEAAAAVIRQQANRTNAARSTQRELNRLNKEARALESANAKEKQAEIDAEIKAQEELRKLEQQKKLEHLTKIEALEDEYFNSLLDKQTQEENAVADKYFNLIEQAKKFGQDTAILEEAQQAALSEIRNRYDEQARLKDEEKRAKEIADLQALEAAKQATRVQALNDLINIAGQETEVGRALLIAKQGLALKELIMQATKTISFAKLSAAESIVATQAGAAQTAKVGFPQNIPLLIGYAAQAAGILSSIKGAVSGAKNVANSFGASGGGGSSAAPQPAFNVVGTSGVNQIAEQLSQEQEPVQAFVVGSNVTTQQELDRNIVTTASLG